MKLTLLISISLLSFLATASQEKLISHIFARPVELPQEFANKVNSQLIENRFNEPTYTLTVKCDKYKKNPEAKDRSVNCYVTSATQTPN